MTARQFAIFDLDNCISDDGWRIPKIDWNAADPDVRYARYHALSPFDKHDNLERVHAHVVDGDEIVVFTARPCHMQEATLHWLALRTVFPAALIMRNRGDRRSSVLIKQEMLTHLPHYDLDLAHCVAAYDDREDIVEMYFKHGIQNAQVLKIHDLCAMTRPADQKETT